MVLLYTSNLETMKMYSRKRFLSGIIRSGFRPAWTSGQVIFCDLRIIGQLQKHQLLLKRIWPAQILQNHAELGYY